MTFDAGRRAFVKQSTLAALALGVRAAPSSSVDAFLAAAAASSLELHSLIIARRGRVVASAWFAPYRPEAPHLLYSLSKSFTSTAVGFLIAEGRLRLSDTLVSFFPEQAPSPRSRYLSELTVEHLLTMSVGHATDTTPVVTRERDWVKTFLQQPIEFKPGSVFLYNSAATYMLSALIQKVTGEQLVHYLRPRFFDPLGLPDMHWQVCPLGINTGGWGLSAITETLMKFGQFYLQRGRWNGRQLLPAKWIAAATRFHIQQPAPPGQDLEQFERTSDWHQGYGYQFWRCRHNAFRGDGAFGQFCIVVPEQDAVIAITSRTLDLQGLLNLVWEHLLPVLPDATPVRKLTLALPESKVSPPPSDALFEIEPNALGVQRLAVSWDNHTLRVGFDINGRTHTITNGIGSWHDGVTELPCTPPEWTELVGLTSGPPHPVKVAAAGAWKDPQTFEMQWRYYETPHFDTVTLRFTAPRVEVTFLNSLTQMAATLHPETRPVLKGLARS